MRELQNIFATLHCNDGRTIQFGECDGEWDAEGRWGPKSDWMLKFGFKVRSEWCEAIGFVEDTLSDMKRFCEELVDLSSRRKSTITYSPVYGAMRLEFTVNRIGNFTMKGEFGLSEYNSGSLYEEFETYEMAIIEFREGIESVLKEIEQIRR